jgi:predicted Zn-dependent protease
MAWTRDDAKTLTEKILSYSRAPECELIVEATENGHTRFAANDVTTAGSSRDFAIAITSRGDGRSGTARVSDTDEAALRQAVARSEELMRAASVDPEAVPPLGPQNYPTIRGFHDETRRAGATQRKEGVAAALTLARGKGLSASGFSETTARWSATANKKGNFGYNAATAASFSTTMRTTDGTGSGWAGGDSPRFSKLPAARLAEQAAKKAVDSAKPQTVDPGRYTVILEPQAVADLLGNIGNSFARRAADEGRSFLSKPGGGNRQGEKIFHESVTIRSDPFDERVPGRPWAGPGGTGGGGGGGGFLGFGGFGSAGFAGLPVRRTTWVEKGVVKTLSVDRYWAAKSNLEPLPFSSSLILEGGSGSVADLIAGAERALLITRFWYIRSVNPQNLLVTGLTRDGVWLVEKGKVTGPVTNFRFNDSALNLLKNVEAMSAPVPTTETLVVPAIRSRDFLFTSKSDAV